MRRAEEPTGAGLRPVKRSFIDSRIDRMLDLCGRHGLALPPFALWGDADFRANPDAARLIAGRGMGWNVVEFKPGLFAREGLTLFTLRMGDWRELGAERGRLYAEKAILAEDGQRAPPLPRSQDRRHGEPRWRAARGRALQGRCPRRAAQ
jgi:D-lyxose ketol-isomerase